MLGFIFWVEEQVLATGQAPGMYMLGFIFLVEKQVPATGQASGTCWALYFGWENRCPQPVRSQVHVGLHNWVKKEVLGTSYIGKLINKNKKNN